MGDALGRGLQVGKMCESAERLDGALNIQEQGRFPREMGESWFILRCGIEKEHYIHCELISRLFS